VSQEGKMKKMIGGEISNIQKVDSQENSMHDLLRPLFPMEYSEYKMKPVAESKRYSQP